MDFFSSCGPITYFRLSGDDGTVIFPSSARGLISCQIGHPTRYAFIEYADKESSDKALLLNGALIRDRPVRVNHSKNAIVKPPLKQLDNRETRRREQRIRRVLSNINRDLGVPGTLEALPARPCLH